MTASSSSVVLINASQHRPQPVITETAAGAAAAPRRHRQPLLCRRRRHRRLRRPRLIRSEPPRRQRRRKSSSRSRFGPARRPLDDVFFDLDEATIRNEARAPLQKNADWMKKWTTTQVAIEGHCDSRGSSEYNLALGSRRATAVKDYLVSLGVAANRVTVISKGKEQPFCSEESESCWQQNRRGHFVVSAK
jgi:peptidoglycan-associated lipoprotein